MPLTDPRPNYDGISRAAQEFVVKDSGAREEFDSGMRRDTEDGKADFTLIRKGPLFKRWAEHLTKGAEKYGRHNWTNANSEEELERFQRSAARHFEQWLAGDRDEDHASAVIFNLNAAEFVRDRLHTPLADLLKRLFPDRDDATCV